MKDSLIHTPDGVRDIYNQEYQRKKVTMDKLCHVLELYNYQGIQTPTFEFFDIFNQEKGSAQSKEMYKFFDRDNNTLVLRPDMTPSVARCVAKYYEKEENHLRLFYKGSTFINNSSYQGKLKEITNVGAELVGDDTSAADGEIISLVVESLLAVGLTEFQVSVGQIDYFKGLVEEAGLDKDTENSLRDAIENKNAFAIEEIIKEAGLSGNLKEAMIHLTDLYGGVEVLENAKKLVTNSRSLKAIDRLEKLYTILSYYGYEEYISFDLGILSRYHYYTGMIFKGYAYGTGDSIVKGGRYNNLMKQFGKDAPSVGFSFEVDELMNALNRQKIFIDIHNKTAMVLYEPAAQKQGIDLAKQLRETKIHTQLTRKSSRKDIDTYLEYSKEHSIDTIYYINADDTLITYDIATGKKETLSYLSFSGGVDQ